LWVCEILVLDLSVLELCGTSDSSSKCHRLVTLGDCHLLDSLEGVETANPSRRL
jgi:hypothetical protein